jgi:hypothetical protein
MVAPAAPSSKRMLTMYESWSSDKIAKVGGFDETVFLPPFAGAFAGRLSPETQLTD